MKNSMKLVGVVLAAGAGVFAAVAFATHKAVPVLAVPAEVDVGRVDNGQVAEVAFDVANNGGATLLLEDLHADCKCMRVFQKDATGTKTIADSVEVPPSRVVHLGVDLNVRGTIGTVHGSSVHFRCNDPAAPVVVIAIHYTPTARLYPTPAMLDFGELALGQSATRRVTLMSDGKSRDFDPSAITCSQPERFSVRFAAAAQQTRDGSAAEEPSAVGDLDVTVAASNEATRIGETLSILGQGRPIVDLPVAAAFVAEYQIAPSMITLPKSSSLGPLYSFTAIVRRTDRSAFALRLPSPPAGFRVAVDNDLDSPIHIATITYTGPTEAEKSVPATVHAKAICRGATADVPIGVVVHSRSH
jgi:hypothetical protein